MTQSEMEKAIAELQAQNTQLRGKVKAAKAPKPTVCTEGEYKGKPTLNFSGEFRPFSLGTAKLQRIMDASEQVSKFLAKHAG